MTGYDLAACIYNADKILITPECRSLVLLTGIRCLTICWDNLLLWL